MATGPGRIVVVGGGAAGLTTVETLRALGADGEITLVGAEQELPYDRPPLSKKVLAGELPVDKLWLRPADQYAPLDVRLVLGDPAMCLDRASRTITCASGRSVGFDGLVIATGADARRMPAARAGDAIHYLRSLADAQLIGERLAERPRTVIIGAGFLGVELAVAARRAGCDVTVVDPLSIPMLRQFGATIGGLVRARHESVGIRFRLGTAVRGVGGSEGAMLVHLGDGEVLAAEFLVGALGSVPSVQWLEGSGLAGADGVVCDPTCRVADGIYVAGDVAAWTGPDGGRPRRFEHRMNATEQGRCATLGLMGDPQTLQPSHYFWSDQGDLRIQAVGEFASDAQLRIVEGHPDEDKFVALSCVHGRVQGVLAWNHARRFAHWRRSLGEVAEFTTTTV